MQHLIGYPITLEKESGSSQDGEPKCGNSGVQRVYKIAPMGGYGRILLSFKLQQTASRVLERANLNRILTAVGIGGQTGDWKEGHCHTTIRDHELARLSIHM